MPRKSYYAVLCCITLFGNKPDNHVDLTESSPEELEKQKLRVACKMEILDFFNGRPAGRTRQKTADVSAETPPPERVGSP